MAEILIVDDEKSCRDAYRRLFGAEGFAVRTARNGDEALRLFAEHRPDVVLLDVDMPAANGFAVCSGIRRTDGETPVIFLTAMETEAGQIRGLGLGADDYVFKTAPDQILVARVNAALARRAAMSGAARMRGKAVSAGRASVDADTFLVSVDGKPTGDRLTKTEFDLFRALASAPGTTLSHDEIAAALRGSGFTMESACLRSHIAHLRRKLGPAGELIVSERDAGYRLVR